MDGQLCAIYLIAGVIALRDGNAAVFEYELGCAGDRVFRCRDLRHKQHENCQRQKQRDIPCVLSLHVCFCHRKNILSVLFLRNGNAGLITDHADGSIHGLPDPAAERV